MRRFFDWRVLILIGIQHMSSYTYAYQFGAREDVSQWRAEPSTHHLCELHHPIPDYGEAVFSQRSGHLLHFQLNSMRPLPNTGSVELTSVAPAWLPQISGRHLGMMTSQIGSQPISTAEPMASLLLDELQSGLFPLITHEGWTEQHPVEVVISAVNFMDAYAAFQSCIAQLLPGDFADFEHSTILFDTDKADIKPQYQQRLNLIAAYVLEDTGVQNVLLVGHTDSVWTAAYNKDLSKRRTLAVKQYLMNKGISEAKLQVSFFGESKPLVANNTPANRQKNRRVVISLEKDKDAAPKEPRASEGLKK
jgi:sodium-type flagellar protein MotY